MSGSVKNMRQERLQSDDGARANKAATSTEKLFMGNRGLDALLAERGIGRNPSFD